MRHGLTATTLAAVCLLVFAGHVRADDALLCDQLASDDVTRAPIVALEAIEFEKAEFACAAALASDPTNPALIHQYARSLERAGKLEDARRLYEWAAADGYGPSVAALARLKSVVPVLDSGWPDADRETLGAQMSATASALRRYAEALPADPANPLTVLEATGTDPDAILTWVTENTRLLAYLGTLRGPRGVSSDRAGNSLDRARVLASLLAQAGQAVRLAHASLDRSQVSALLVARRELDPLPSVARLTGDQLVGLFADVGMANDEFVTTMGAVVDRKAKADQMLDQRTAVLLPGLEEAAQFAAEGADAEEKSRALSALSDHYWVQMRAGTGWRDMDPDAATVGALVATDTLEPEKLPDDFRHSVVLRVVVELQDETGRREETLLNHTVYADEDGAQTLTLSNNGEGLDSLDQLLEAPDLPSRLLEKLDDVAAWTPILITGTTTIVDKLFTRDGAIRNANVAAFSATGADIGGLFTDVATELGGGAPADTPKSVPTAEWLEIEVRVPGQQARVERRTIFDLIGSTARSSRTPVTITADLLRARALRLVGTTDILVTGATPSDVSVTRTSARTAATIADAIAAIAAKPGDVGPSDAPSGARTPLVLLRFATQRLEGERRPALLSPNVVLFHDRFDWDASAARITHQGEFDIVANDVGAISFEDRVRQGLRDTILEDALLADPRAGNVAALETADLAAGNAWHRVVTADDVQTSGLSTEAKSRAAADLAAGFIVVAPRGSTVADPGAGWWRIDPKTGTSIGMMSSGGGADLVESAFLFYQAASSAACFVSLVTSIRDAIGGDLGLGQAGVGMAICGAAGLGAGGLAFGLGAAGAGTAAGAGAAGGLGILAALAAQGVR